MRERFEYAAAVEHAHIAGISARRYDCVCTVFVRVLYRELCTSAEGFPLRMCGCIPWLSAYVTDDGVNFTVWVLRSREQPYGWQWVVVIANRLIKAGSEMHGPR